MGQPLAESFDRSLPWVLAAWLTGTTLLLCRLNIGTDRRPENEINRNHTSNN